MRVGYLIPEFPGQTHIFFWREMRALQSLGVEVETVSTRRPPAGIVCHAWSKEAMQKTHYLFPPNPLSLARAMATMMLSGPRAWGRCLSVIRSVDGATIREKAQMAALALVGRQLADLARDRRWDHVHVHSCGDSALIATFAHEISGLDYSLTLHGPIQHYRKGQDVKWGRARFGITVTNRLRHEVLATVRTIDDSKIGVASMGVDTEAFQRSSPYEPPSADGRTRIVTCGRLHEHKGHQDLIAAVDLLTRKGRDVELRILGEGPARELLEHEIERRGLEDRVSLLGAVAEEVVRAELERAHVFALGSHDEAIGVATMEGMAMGLPVVVTDVGGVSELVDDGVCGLLVGRMDPEAVAGAVERLIADPQLCREMAARGRLVVESRFDSRVSARLLRDRIFGAAIEQRRKAA